MCLAAGLDGIERGLTPPAEMRENIYSMTAEERAANNITALPGDLKEALECLKKDDVIMGVLGEHVANHYVAGKMKEWNEYQTRVSSWELEKYLVTY